MDTQNTEETLEFVTTDSPERKSHSITHLRTSRVVRWSLTLVIIVMLPILVYPHGEQDAVSILVMSALVLFVICILIGLWARPAISVIGFKVAAMITLLAYTLQFVRLWFIEDRPFGLFGLPGEPTRRNALLGLILYALPCLIYLIRGKKPPV